MWYKNIGRTSKTFHSVTFKPGETKEVLGYINAKSFIRVDAPDVKPAPKPEVKQPAPQSPKQEQKPAEPKPTEAKSSDTKKDGTAEPKN